MDFKSLYWFLLCTQVYFIFSIEKQILNKKKCGVYLKKVKIAYSIKLKMTY